MIAADSPLAAMAVAAVQAGDVDAVARLLAAHPGLARERLGDELMSRTLLHALTDWPGHVPDAPRVADLLLAHGADVDARFAGPHRETPLHWAASADDVAMLDWLLDHGADIEADGAVIGGGTPLADAVAFGQWNAAHRLVDRGAAMTIEQAAGLGELDVVRAIVVSGPVSPDTLTNALWYAAHGGRRDAAELLAGLGANPAWVGWDGLTAAGAAEREGHHDLAAWLTGQAATDR